MEKEEEKDEEDEARLRKEVTNEDYADNQNATKIKDTMIHRDLEDKLFLVE